VHRINPPIEGGLAAFNARLRALGFELNGEGGEVKASPDGLLLQSSTVADVDAAAELPAGAGGGKVGAGLELLGGAGGKRVAGCMRLCVRSRLLLKHA
jgi:hypothetical protein